jgi:hypothetical protein
LAFFPRLSIVFPSEIVQKNWRPTIAPKRSVVLSGIRTFSNGAFGKYCGRTSGADGGAVCAVYGRGEHTRGEEEGKWSACDHRRS